MRSRFNYIEALREITDIIRQEIISIAGICELSSQQRFITNSSDKHKANKARVLSSKVILNLSKELILEIEKDDVAYFALELKSLESLLIVLKHSVLLSSNIRYKSLLKLLADDIKTLDEAFSMLSSIKKNSAKIIEICCALSESLNDKYCEQLMQGSSQVIIEIIISIRNIAERIICAVLRVT